MFIVIDGIDGAGKGRQRTELVKYLTDKQHVVSTTDFPDHEGQIYKHIIHPALHEEFEMKPQTWFLSFMLDQLLWADKINKSVKSKSKHFISDGYFTTTMVYQCLLTKVMSVKDALKLAKKFELPRPDVIVYVDVDPEIAMKRKLAEDGHEEGLDIFERNIKKQRKLRESFLKLAHDNTWTKWVVVDGNQSIEEVRDSIILSLENLKLIK